MAEIDGWDEDPIRTCQSGKAPECGKETNVRYLNGTFGLDGGLHDEDSVRTVVLCKACFKWEHWLEKAREFQDSKKIIAIVEGAHYTICPEEHPPIMHGYGGRNFTIRFHDGREMATTNLWFQGVIPDGIRKILPDNAIFLGDKP